MSLAKKTGQPGSTPGILQLVEGLRLDLTHTLASHTENQADLLERVGIPIADSVTQLQNLSLAVGQRLEHLVDFLAQHLVRGHFGRPCRTAVLDKIAQVRLVGVRNRPVQTRGRTGHSQHRTSLLERYAGRVGQLLRRRLAVILVQKRVAGLVQSPHGRCHVHRQADGPTRVGNRSCDRLANPPRGVRRKLVTSQVLVLLHRSHQTRIALLDQIQKTQASLAILLGNRNDQSQVSVGQVLLGLLVVHIRNAQATQSLGDRTRRLECQLPELLQLGSSLRQPDTLGPRSTDRRVQLGHPSRNLLVLLENRAQLLLAKTQLLEQLDHPPSSGLHSLARYETNFLSRS